jgi:hypothetical protein
MSQQNGVLELLIAAITANTAAVEALTAAQGGAAASDAGSKTTAKTTNAKTTKTTKADDKPKSKYTKQQVTDAIVALKDAKGQAEAKAVLQASGFAKLADITEDKFDELHDAAVEALGGGDEDNSSDDDI